LSFHVRPNLRPSDLVLPPGLLQTIEQQVIGVARHASRLRASGQHLKRGMLLYGPPGTGKTHTVRYLISQLREVTVIQVSGRALQAIGAACSIARALQPAMVVVEDVDLIAEDRGSFPGQQSLLFELLNEMDGLREDSDVVFVLTTNRPDLLEPALAARPGRVDQAIEFDVPDAAARRQLLELYRGPLRLDLDSLGDVIDRTDGVTASFLKELLRRAALLAAEREGEELSVEPADVRAALDDLLAERNSMTRVLLGARRPWDRADPMTAWLQRGDLQYTTEDGPSPYH
jgi:ATP-dependent 26S proteasome regulatory subunit